MSYIDHFINFLFDEDRRLSSKAAVVVFIVVAIVFVDNILGFSYSFSLDKKIEQVQKLNLILKDSTTDSTTKSFAINLRSQIIERKDIVSQTLSFFRGKSNSVIKHHANNPPATPRAIEVSIKNNFWFNISASGIYFLLAIIMIPLMLFADKTTSLSQRLATGIATTVSFILFALFFIWVLGLIPQITNSTWIWNYLINFIIQVIIMGLLVHLSQQKK